MIPLLPAYRVKYPANYQRVHPQLRHLSWYRHLIAPALYPTPPLRHLHLSTCSDSIGSRPWRRRWRPHPSRLSRLVLLWARVMIAAAATSPSPWLPGTINLNRRPRHPAPDDGPIAFTLASCRSMTTRTQRPWASALTLTTRAHYKTPVAKASVDQHRAMNSPPSVRQ